MNISKNQKEYAKQFLSIFNEKPSIIKYENELKNKCIDILSVQYFNYNNINFFSTIGLLNYDFGIKSNNKDLRMELITAFYKDFKHAGNLLSNCVFDILDYKELRPNLILSNITNQYISTELTEIWITFPNLLNKKYITIEFNECYVTKLQMIPISKKEAEIVLTEGGSKLNNLFCKKNIDLYNIFRKSIK